MTNLHPEENPLSKPVEPDAIELMRLERIRQVKVKHYTLKGDRAYSHRELLRAAMGYLAYVTFGLNSHIPSYWPWSVKAWRPAVDPIKTLVKAGALIAAHVDKLLADKADGL